MSSPVVLITGCSTGIGLASAVHFAGQGCTVVATMRNLDRSGLLRDSLHAAGVEAEIRVLDVNSDVSVADTVAGVIADHGRVDIVISNAGIGVAGTTEELSLDDFKASIDTNLFGAIRLLHAVLPSMRASGSGRFIAVSSISGALGLPFNDAYCASKNALEGLLESLYPVAAKFGVHVSLVEPGPVQGEFVTNSSGPTGGVVGDPYGPLREAFTATQAGGYESAQTNPEIAQVIWQVATADAPVLRYQTSESVAKLVGVKLKDLTGERLTGLTARWI
jgi:NAD(P)-dependent dehydrogenase (short-subunit alcohol dehydrogenase family)